MKNIFNQKPFIVTPVMEERTILVAYDEGSAFDRFVVHFTRKHNHKVEALYQSHLEVIRETKSALQEAVCSEELEDRLLAICEDGRPEYSFNEWLIQFGHGLRATGAIAAVCVIGFLVWTNSSGPTQEQLELERATLEARETLAMVSSIMNGTKDDLHDRVIIKRTAKPLYDSIFKGTESIRRNI